MYSRINSKPRLRFGFERPSLRLGYYLLVPRAMRTLVCALLLGAFAAAGFAQGRENRVQNELSPTQRLDVMRSKLEAMRRSLDSALAGLNAKDASEKEKPSPDDPRERLRGLDKEVGSVLNDVNELHAKQDRSERYDTSRLDALEASVADLNTRVQAALQSTASERSADASQTTYRASKPKKGGHLFGLFGRSHSGKYTDLTGTVAPGRDRVLFEEATKQVRKGNHETGRLLFTTVITTYPDSPYLPLAKLAVADSFYLEGTTAALIQAGQAYQDWLTFFPTDPLADYAMLKVADAEIRQMGLPDRDVTHARKAEQRLKALLQQFPQTRLRPEVDGKIHQVQENLAKHDFLVAQFHYERYIAHKGGLKGAQSRWQEIVEKYPFFCLMDETLYRLAWTYQEQEEPDVAAKYYQQIVRDYPNSDYVEKAKEQLNVIGAPIPEADPIKKTMPQCDKPTFMQNMKQQITGSANVSVSHDGILITKHGEGKDLIDMALTNNGQLPSNEMPRPYRTPPARPPAPVASPSTQPESSPDKKKVGISVQPSPNGPQPDRINPSAPANTPRTQPPPPKPQPSPETKPGS